MSAALSGRGSADGAGPTPPKHVRGPARGACRFRFGAASGSAVGAVSRRFPLPARSGEVAGAVRMPARSRKQVIAPHCPCSSKSATSACHVPTPAFPVGRPVASWVMVSTPRRGLSLGRGRRLAARRNDSAPDPRSGCSSPPLLVLLSFVLAPDPIPLVFNGYKTGALLLAALITTVLTSDGESTQVRGRRAARRLRDSRARVLLRLSRDAALHWRARGPVVLVCSSISATAKRS
jgi:hypothetical protein